MLTSANPWLTGNTSESIHKMELKQIQGKNDTIWNVTTLSVQKQI